MDIELTHKGVKVEVLEGPYVVDDKVTEAGVAFYSEIVDSLDSIREHAANALHSLYNETWIDDEIGELTVDQMKERLTNPEVWLYEERNGCVYFDDSDMFAGHSIHVSIEDGQPTHVQLRG